MLVALKYAYEMSWKCELISTQLGLLILETNPVLVPDCSLHPFN